MHIATPKKVVVVDDEPSVCLLARRVLEKQGYAVKTFPDAEQALAYAATEKFDVVVVDRNLPRVSGLELVRQLRERMPLLPVVLITAVPDAAQVQGERIDVYLAKPFRSLKALEDAVAQALDLAATARVRDDMQRRLSEVMAQLQPKAAQRH